MVDMKGIVKAVSMLLLIAGFTQNAAAKIDLLLPSYQCTLTNQRNSYDISNVGMQTFMHGNRQIFLVCESNNVVRGDSLRAVWIADNTSRREWDNYVIAQQKAYVSNDLTALDLFKHVFTIDMPPGGWPNGTYHVRVYINGSSGYKYPFEIR